MPKKITLYHLSHKNNFESIIKTGSIYSQNVLNKKKIKHHDISFISVQRRRDKLIPQSNHYIHQCVPFFYRPLTPMLYSKKSEAADLFLAELSLEEVLHNKDIIYYFTDGNAATHNTNFYQDWKKDSHRINWYTIKKQYWEPNEKSAASAEFLVFSEVPLSLIYRINVMLPGDVHFYKQKLKEYNIKNIDVVTSRKCFP